VTSSMRAEAPLAALPPDPPELGAPAAHRFELKLPLDNRTPAAVYAAIRRHPLGFERLHPERRVSSIYFDTPALTCLYTSVEGMSRRVKLRLRWYGDDDAVDAGQLEWKWRRGREGWKWTVPVAWEGELAKQRWSELRTRLREGLDGRQRAVFDALGVPALLVRYERAYWVSRDGRCRLTVDRALRFAAQTGGLAPQLRGEIPAHRVQVLELKLPVSQPELAREALQGFPYRAARFSKYTAGLAYCLPRLR
jgi:hypothetical protein